MSYEIDYNDKRFQEVEADKNQALTENKQLYDGMVSGSDKYYQDQINASKEWADKQTALQQEKTDFAIEQIEQQKEQAQKDYTREQSGAYVDWQKQSNNYGANAEQQASLGMTNSGYSESSQVQMYTTYQNRVATARESYNRAVLNYDNAIKDARLQNNSILAEIAYESLQKQLELSLQGFQYKNQLLIEQSNKKLEIDQMYHQRYQDVLNQMNTENALAEQVRQFNESIALEREKFAWQKSQASAKSSGGSSKSSGGGGGVYSNKGSGGSGGSYTGNNSTQSSKKAVDVNTEYYRGALNSDVEKYGAFSNGYQPKGISGYGEVKKARESIDVDTVVMYGAKKGESRTVTQNVWKTKDGTRWYWEGRQNKYIKLK